MLRKIFTLLIAFSTVILSGQNITLLKNFNPKAKELKHDLNFSQDTLMLSSESRIEKVDIFNEDFEKIVDVKNHESRISLIDLPEGIFVVEARLEDKIITMKIVKHSNEYITNDLNKSNIAEGKGMMLDERLNVITSAPKRSIAHLLSGKKSSNISTKQQKFYWTITKVNNEIGSSKTMKLVDEKSVERMILRNKLENDRGQSNELRVWEVHNTTKFMENQLSNPEFINSSQSDVFNPLPYYDTHTTASL